MHTCCVVFACFLANVCVFLAYVLYNMFFFDFEYVCSHPFFGDKLNQYRGSGPAFEHRTLSTATLWPRVEGLGGNPKGASNVYESYGSRYFMPNLRKLPCLPCGQIAPSTLSFLRAYDSFDYEQISIRQLNCS